MLKNYGGLVIISMKNEAMVRTSLEFFEHPAIFIYERRRPPTSQLRILEIPRLRMFLIKLKLLQNAICGRNPKFPAQREIF